MACLSSSCLTRLKGLQENVVDARGACISLARSPIWPGSTRQIIILVCDACTWTHERDARSRLRPLHRPHFFSRHTLASSAAPSQSTPTHRLASRSPCLDSATHRMLICSCSRARVDVCVCGRATCNSGCDGTGTGQGGRTGVGRILAAA